MSYFVTLPSNGADLTSEYGINNNTQTDFEIDLKKPLDLSYRDYEVGLSQFSCELSWLINIGKFKISHKTKKYDDIEFDLSCSDGIHVSNMIDIIDRSVKNIELPIEYNKQIGTDVIQFKFDIDSKFLFIYVPNDYELTIKGFFLTLIDYFKADASNHKKKNFTASDSLIILGKNGIAGSCVLTKLQVNQIKELFIYTNIIENQYVGSQMVRLLKIVYVSGLNGDSITKNFDFPHYLSLDCNYIDNIRIFIRDSDGEKIKFTDNYSRVTYKLHFRPKTV